MSNSIISTSSNTYALQDIFSDKRVENPSSDQEGIGALQNIIQSKLPSAVKAFFQTLWECIAHSKSWNEGKLTVALNNADIGDRCTILEKLSENLEKFDENTRDVLGKFVTGTISSNYDEFIKNSAHVCRILDAAEKLPGSLKQELKNSQVLYDEEFIKARIQRCAEAKLQSNGNINQKIEDWDAIVNGMSNFDEKIQPHVRRYVMRSMLADYREISQNPQLKEQAMDIARKFPFDTSFQAELTVALNDPDCYEKVQNIDEFAINIHDNYDETFGEEIKNYEFTIPAYKTRNAISLDKLKQATNSNLFDHIANTKKNKKAYEDFFEAIQCSDFVHDIVNNRTNMCVKIGDEELKFTGLSNEDGRENQKKQIESILKMIYNLCKKNINKEEEQKKKFIDLTYNFFTHQHLTGNQTPKFVIEVMKKHGDLEQQKMQYENSLITYQKNCINATEVYDSEYHIVVTNDYMMYSSEEAKLNYESCKQFFEKNSQEYCQREGNNDKFPLKKGSVTMFSLITKVDLNKEINKDTKIPTSFYWRAGTTKEENISLDTPTNITNPNLHA